MLKLKNIQVCKREVTYIMSLSLFIIFWGCSSNPPPKAAPMATEVVAVTVSPTTVPVAASFVAQVQSSHQVDVMARVSGFLEKILYKEGELVQEGQLLFQIDRKPFQAQLESVRAEVDSRKAQLWTAKANLDRIKPLAEQNAVSKSDLDNATGNVQAAEAALAEAKARFQKAELDLGYTIIKSPVTGVSSQSLMREGSYLSASGANAKLTYVAKLDPIWIDFSVSQNEFDKMREETASGLIIGPKNNRYNVELELADGVKYPLVGKLSFADPSFSKETGTFLVRAEIANPKGVLKPGMFVKAYVKGTVRPNAVVVPQKALQQTANGHIVYIASDKDTAEIRPVIAGEWLGQDWIINKGLKTGDRVIVEGFQKLAPGAPVKVVQAGATSAASSSPAGQPTAESSSPAPPAKK